MTLQELEAKLAAAVGPDRELDLQISVAINFKGVFEPGNWSWSVFADEIKREGGGILDPVQFVPQWTRSIDRALTLVTEGWHWQVGTMSTGALPCAQLAEPAADIGGFGPGIKMRQRAEAHTAPLALCLAAIRARIATAANATALPQERPALDTPSSPAVATRDNARTTNT